MKNILLGGLLLISAAQAAPKALPTSNTPPTAAKAPAKTVKPTLKASPEVGKMLYMANCVGCHGLNSKGGLAPNIQAAGKVSAAVFQSSLLRGKSLKGAPMSLVMPRYTGGLRPNLGRAPTAAEMKSLQLYLQNPNIKTKSGQ